MQDSMFKFRIYEAICGWLCFHGRRGKMFYTKAEIWQMVPKRRGCVMRNKLGSRWMGGRVGSLFIGHGSSYVCGCLLESARPVVGGHSVVHVARIRSPVHGQYKSTMKLNGCRAHCIALELYTIPTLHCTSTIYSTKVCNHCKPTA
jgi:hypothetical protein